MQDTGLSRLLSGIETTMKYAAAACLMAMALVTGTDVLGRGAFNTPVFGSEEIVSLLAVLVVGFSLPYTHSQGSHIGVEVVYRALSRRSRRILSITTHLLSAALFGVVAWRMLLYGLSMKRVGVVSMNLALPTHYLLYVLAGCFAVFALFLLATILGPHPEDH